MSQLGQKRKSGDPIATSELPLKADIKTDITGGAKNANSGSGRRKKEPPEGGSQF